MNDNIVLAPNSRSAVLMLSLAHSSIYQSHMINSTDFKKRSGKRRTEASLGVQNSKYNQGRATFERDFGRADKAVITGNRKK